VKQTVSQQILMGSFCSDGYFIPRITGNFFSSLINMKCAESIYTYCFDACPPCIVGTRAKHHQIVSDVDRHVIIGKLLEFIFIILSVILRRWEIQTYLH
jgi:uncharacterized membrane protein